jgi:hypothetical protein
MLLSGKPDDFGDDSVSFYAWIKAIKYFCMIKNQTIHEEITDKKTSELLFHLDKAQPVAR